jgi:ketosteroid isomerase-like protein
MGVLEWNAVSVAIANSRCLMYTTRRAILLLVGTLSIASCQTPRATDGISTTSMPATEAEIRERTSAFSAAVVRASASGWQSAEVSALADFYDAHTVVFPPRGATLRGRSALQSYWTRSADRKILEHNAVAERIDVSGQLATEHGQLRLTIQTANGPVVRDSATYVSYWRRSEDGRWRKRLDTWW